MVGNKLSSVKGQYSYLVLSCSHSSTAFQHFAVGILLSVFCHWYSTTFLLSVYCCQYTIVSILSSVTCLQYSVISSLLSAFYPPYSVTSVMLYAMCPQYFDVSNFRLSPLFNYVILCAVFCVQ